MARKRIGELLVERKAITEDQLFAALATQKATGKRLGVILVEKGYVAEVQLVQVLSTALGVPTVDLNTADLDSGAVALLRGRFCEQHTLFPYGIEKTADGHKRLLVAMANPLDHPAIEEIEFTTGLPVVVRLCPLSHIRTAVLKHYHAAPTPSAPANALGATPDGTTDSYGVVVPGRTSSGETPMVVGQELLTATSQSEREAVEALIAKSQAESMERRRNAGPGPDLFGTASENAAERLEGKFWALVRLLARKGLLTKEEFKNELDENAS